jgi:hypothetical protein
MPEPSFPARLHVLLARTSSQALVIRRGPSKHACTIGWNRARDTFEDGQWLRGRIYERRCDLSPDGKWFLYFAMNGHWSSATRGSWTAISRTPWLRAIVLLGKGDCWNGGGLFTGSNSYWLNDGYGHRIMQESRHVIRDLHQQPEGRYGGECPGVYYNRLTRDGWRLLEHIVAGPMEALTVFEKDIGHGWLLRKLAHEEVGAPVGNGCYWDEHELEHSGRQQRIACPDWQWAEWDRDALIYASKGCLYRAPRPSDAGLGEAKLIRDFNDMTFEARRAPYRD